MKNYSLKFKSFYFFIVVFTFSFLLFNFCQGAILYLEPSTGQFHQDDIFVVEIRLDTQGETINAVEVNLSFDKDVLEFKDFSKGNSILTLWTEEPKFSEIQSPTVISFSGGVPGGYWGADGLLGKLALQARGITQIATQNNAEIKFLEGSKVLLNDGKGTEASLSFKEAGFNILAQEGEGKNLWQEEIAKDKILPEPFKIELVHNPAVFDGKYFIIFSTTDKQTGIDRYEVKEGKEKWQVAASPYVLKNQKLTDDIHVKAIDKAGNYWMETLKAQNKPKEKWENFAVLILGLAAFVLIVIILRIIRRKKYQ